MSCPTILFESSNGVMLRELHTEDQPEFSLGRADLETIDAIGYHIQPRRDFNSHRGKLVKILAGPFQQFTVELLRLPIKESAWVLFPLCSLTNLIASRTRASPKLSSLRKKWDPRLNMLRARGRMLQGALALSFSADTYVSPIRRNASP